MNMIKKLSKYIIIVLFAFVLFNIFNNNNIRVAKGFGPSMGDTIPSGSITKCDKNFYNKNDIKINDIVTIKIDNHKDYFVKRIVAKAGDVISVNENFELLINNKVENDTKTDVIIDFDKNTHKSYTLKENEVFALGDNRTNSTDSRNFGVIKKENIVGKIIEINGKTVE